MVCLIRLQPATLHEQNIFLIIHRLFTRRAWGNGRAGYCETSTIQKTPNLSATIPKRFEKKVFIIGACTCPPSASAANKRSASASVAAVSDSENPLKLGLPVHCPSDAMMTELPMRTLACMTLSPELGAHIEG